MNTVELQILDIYLNSGIRMKHYEKACTEDIGFDIITLKKLVGLLKSGSIQIQCIELFKKPDFQFDGSDFWYNGSSLVENYKLVDEFLLPRLNESRYCMNLRIFDSSFKDQLDVVIYEKYGDLDPLPPPIGKPFD